MTLQEWKDQLVETLDRVEKEMGAVVSHLEKMEITETDCDEDELAAFVFFKLKRLEDKIDEMTS